MAAKPRTRWLRRSSAWGVTLAVALGAAPDAHGATIVVDNQASCSDSQSVTEPSTTPYCTLNAAAGRVTPGDLVTVMGGTYRGAFAPLRSGTAAAPIRFVAGEAGVVLDGAGAAATVKLIRVSHLTLENLSVTGALNQGIWMDSAVGIRMLGLTVHRNTGAGFSIKASTGPEISGSTIQSNGSAGIMELTGTVNGLYMANTISQNGIGGLAYNGDGIQLGGKGALVVGNTIAANGDPGPSEHGIYAAAVSSGWRLERNTFSDSGGANIKASGSGVIKLNRLHNGRHGIVFASNPQPVETTENVITGSAQHLVFFLTGSRARLDQNTIHQTGRATTSGDASAVFIAQALSAKLRNNLICYDNSDDLGIALWVNAPSLLEELEADMNWFCSNDATGHHLAWAGTRATLASWRASSGQDDRSVAGPPPSFDADGRVTSPPPLLGAGIADPLTGIVTDFTGRLWPEAGWNPGAYLMP